MSKRRAGQHRVEPVHPIFPYPRIRMIDERDSTNPRTALKKNKGQQPIGKTGNNNPRNRGKNADPEIGKHLDVDA